MGRASSRVRKVKADVKPAPRNRFALIEEDAVEAEYVTPVAPKFVPANNNQKIALGMMREGRSVIFLAGSAGVGKSMLAAYYAAEQLRLKKVEKVYLIRPAVAVGKSIGLLPGEISDKLRPYFAQTLAHLEKFMGKGFLKYCLEKQVVEMKPSEFLRGMSFERCICIAEESQNYTKDEFECVLTRLGEGACLILTGDEKQHDLRGASGLHQTLEMLERIVEEQPHYLLDEDLDEMDSKIGVVRFTPDDVVRSGLTRAFVKMYYNN